MTTNQKHAATAIAAAVATVAAILWLTFSAGAAHASEVTAPPAVAWSSCPNLAGWYVNPDETGDRPEATVDGLSFTDKDLIHHKTSLALTDVHAGTFEAAGAPDKLVMKYETDSPYTTIVQTPGGQFWSSHITSGPGSQADPVATPHDLIGIPQRGASGGLTEDTRVVSFGPAYWTEDGTATVDAVQFHGVTYDLTCKIKPSPSAASSSAMPAPSHSTATGHAAPSLSAGTGALAITGPSTGLLATAGAGIVALGGLLIAFLARRRRVRFSA